MGLTLSTVEALAPDQPSLKAASKLMKPAKWPLRAREEGGALIWGECQGSGANPYRVMADTSDQGYKCTCPSRKFPCKHVLALMWMYAEEAGAFSPEEIPEWVTDWLGRRRKGGAKPESKKESKAGPAKSLTAAAAAEAPAAPDPKAEARRKAAAEKRAAATRRSILAATEDMEQWIADQLRTGLNGFLAESTERCRRIAARLVDAKAAALASRIDEMPARLLALPAEQRPDAAISELGKLVLLARAWRAAPDDPELRRSVATGETREQVLEDSEARRVSATWEVLGEEVTTLRDGLISQATWLLNLDEGPQRFALLLDFFPAATGRRGGAFSAGEQFSAELAFYRAATPLRAIIVSREPANGAAKPWCNAAGADPLAGYAAALESAPWSLSAPLLLPAGRICSEPSGQQWWRAAEGGATLPLAEAAPTVALGVDLSGAAGIWTGTRLTLLAGQSDWGRLSFEG
ncbi:MAG: SWIM zinc finger family protein [Kiloniellales bacterium]|nr:SWIM zinc finger family protein [Kiloniellales bacterium]